MARDDIQETRLSGPRMVDAFEATDPFGTPADGLDLELGLSEDDRQAVLDGLSAIKPGAMSQVATTATTFLTMQALSSSFTRDLLKSLDNSKIPVSKSFRDQGLTYVITAVASVLTAIATGYNVKHPNIELPPAAEQFLTSAFGGSFMFMIGRFLAPENSLQESGGLAAFIATTLAIPLISTLMASTTIPDKAYKSVLGMDYDEFIVPKEQQSVRQNLYNAVSSALTYGLMPTVFLALVNREAAGHSIDIPAYQQGAAGSLAIVMAVSGYLMQSKPKQFAYLASGSAVLQSSALMYEALSGIAAMILSGAGSDIDTLDDWKRDLLIVACALTTLGLAINKFKTTQPRLEEWRQSYGKTVEKFSGALKWIQKQASTLARGVTDAAVVVGDGVTGCTTSLGQGARDAAGYVSDSLSACRARLPWQESQRGGMQDGEDETLRLLDRDADVATTDGYGAVDETRVNYELQGGFWTQRERPPEDRASSHLDPEDGLEYFDAEEDLPAADGKPCTIS
jgi:hypothetical protein